MSFNSLRASDFIYGFVGLGLMGGSFARGIREKILCTQDSKGDILACDVQEASLKLAESQGIISKGFSLNQVDQMLEICDVVFVCLYPHATLNFILEHQDAFKKNAIITDISGVKTELLEGLDKNLRDDLDYISGHPMAGSEKEGFSHSSSDIFKNRNYILMPHEKNNLENLEFFKNLVTTLGFRRIIETDACTHDHKIAFTSQLCHIIAAALVDSAEDTNITAFGGGSFEDLTRIAMINAPLWTELFAANKDELLKHIDSFEKSLSLLKNNIEKNDKESMKSILENVRLKRIAMSRIEQH